MDIKIRKKDSGDYIITALATTVIESYRAGVIYQVFDRGDKILAIKVVRDLYGLSLTDAKKLVETIVTDIRVADRAFNES